MSSSDEDEDTVDHQLKITLVGDCAAGKTSLCSRLSQEQFNTQYKQTMGIDFFLKRYTLPGNVNVTLQVWDIGGHDYGGKMLETYLYGAQGVVFVYDITNLTSFDNLTTWLTNVKEIFKNASQKLPHMVLVGNKKDLEHLRTVRKEKYAEFAKEHSLNNFLLSAKSGDQVSYCFQKIAADILGIRLSKQEVEHTNRVIKADIVTYTEKEAPQRTTANQTRSSMCSLQ